MYTNGAVREMRGKGQSSTLSQLISFIRNIIFHKDNKRISHLSPTAKQCGGDRRRRHIVTVYITQFPFELSFLWNYHPSISTITNTLLGTHSHKQNDFFAFCTFMSSRGDPSLLFCIIQGGYYAKL